MHRLHVAACFLMPIPPSLLPDELLLWFLACQLQYVFPLCWSHRRHTKPGLLNHLKILERHSGLAMRLQILEGDLLPKFAAIFNVDDDPLWVFSLGLRVVVWVLGIESGLCHGLLISNMIKQCNFEGNKPSVEYSWTISITPTTPGTLQFEW